MIYFNTAPSFLNSVDELEQRKRVIEFQKNVPQEGSYWLYKGRANFIKQVRMHLTNYIRTYDNLFPIREVLAACYRRAVFAKFHAQLNVHAMFDSLSECRSTLQRIIVFVKPEEQQQLVAKIIGELDLLERIGKEPTSWYGPDRVDTIDGAKLRIINALAKLSNAAQIPFVLPTTLTQESF